MRVILALAAVPLLGAAAPDRPVNPLPIRTPVIDPTHADERCPETPMSIARRQGERLVPRPLNELPPAQAFAAVDRRIDNCPAPMLMSEVRR